MNDDKKLSDLAKIQELKETEGWKLIEERMHRAIEGVKRQMTDLDMTTTMTTQGPNGQPQRVMRTLSGDEFILEYGRLQGRLEGMLALPNELKSIEREGKRAVSPKIEKP